MALLKRRKLLNLPLKPLRKPSLLLKTSTCRISKTSSQQQRELLLAKHRREEPEQQNENMLRLAQQKQELDRQGLTQEKERLEQEEDRMRKEQALMLAELEADNRRELAEATSTELELTEDVLEASRSLRDAFV